MAPNPKPDPKAQEQETEVAPPAASSGKMPKLIVLGVILAVVLLEAIGFVLLMPKGGGDAVDDAVNRARQEGGQPPAVGPVHIDPPEVPLKGISEMRIGEKFTVENPQPNSPDGRSDKFEATLFAVVDKKDEAEFTKIYEPIQNTVRFELTQILKTATVAQKTDPKYVYILHQAQVKLNTLLGKPLVKRVIAPDANYTPP